MRLFYQRLGKTSGGVAPGWKKCEQLPAWVADLSVDRQDLLGPDEHLSGALSRTRSRGSPLLQTLREADE